MHQLNRTWLYFICVHKVLPYPAGLQRPALEKHEVFCCPDVFSVAGLRTGLIKLAALLDPVLCSSSAVFSAEAALCTVAAAALVHQLCFHSLSLFSSPPASKPFSSHPATCCNWPPSPLHLWKCSLETCSQPHPSHALRTPFAAGHVVAASHVAASTFSHPLLTTALLPDLQEITVLLSCATVSLSGFNLSFLLRLEAAVCDKLDGTVTAWSQLGTLL